MATTSQSRQKQLIAELDQLGRLGACYREMAEQQHIHYDRAQVSALKVLQNLSNEIHTNASYKKPSLVSRLFSPPGEKIKGVYIHGDVGRGKSMLMDLFFDHCPVSPKRRVHFHAFMIEVHSFMHEWRKSHEGDPIIPLSQRIRESATIDSRSTRRGKAICDLDRCALRTQG